MLLVFYHLLCLGIDVLEHPSFVFFLTLVKVKKKVKKTTRTQKLLTIFYCFMLDVSRTDVHFVFVVTWFSLSTRNKKIKIFRLHSSTDRVM